MEKSINRTSLLISCGETYSNDHDMTHTVTICPIRHHLLKEKGINAYLLGNFGPLEKDGKKLDESLHETLEKCLHDEVSENPSLKWAPLAIQQVKWRLSRYLWLKACFRNIVLTLKPHTVVLSSERDKDILYAVKSVVNSCGISLTVAHGPLDQTTNILYLLAPYGLPTYTDPHWFVWLQWRFIKLFRKNIRNLYQPYWNLNDLFERRENYPFYLHRAVGLFGRVWRKILSILQLPVSESIVELSIDIDETLPYVLTNSIWKDHFSKDEMLLINSIMHRFVKHYPVHLLNKIERNIAITLSTLKPERIVLMQDGLDASRMLAYGAHKKGIQVDYLVHGIYWEDASGVKKDSPFLPDRIIAWNRFSQGKFMESGWPSVAAKHPYYQARPKAFKYLHKKWNSMKVLVLIPEWILVSQAGREDCAIVDLIAILSSLCELGLSAKNIDVKYHQSVEFANELKEKALIKLMSQSDLRFNILKSDLETILLVPRYDLVITGLNSGIYEAILLGVPIVIYGLSPQRTGGISHFRLPYARTDKELVKTLENYDNEEVAHIYNRIADSLQSGMSLYNNGYRE